MLCFSFLFCVWLLHNYPAWYKLKFRIEHKITHKLKICCRLILQCKPQILSAWRFVESGDKSFVNIVELNLNCGLQIQETSPHTHSLSHSIVVRIYRGLEFLCKSDCVCLQPINTSLRPQDVDTPQCADGERFGAQEEEVRGGGYSAHQQQCSSVPASTHHGSFAA